MQKCKTLGHRLAQLLMEPFILLYDQYLLLLMSRIAVLCCYVHSEREKQSTPHIDQDLAAVDKIIPNILDPLPAILATIVFAPVLHHHVGDYVYRDREDHLVV